MSVQPPPISIKARLVGPVPPVIPKHVSAPPPKPPRPSHWEGLFRVVIVLVILISVGVAYWSFFHHFLPLQNQARSMVTRASTLSASLDELERRWSPEEVEDIRARYREVYAQLFANESELSAWLLELRTQAAPLGLDLQVNFGPGVPRQEFSTNLAVIPASIAMEVRPTEDDVQGKSPYERVLAFGQHLAVHGKRADLAELTVTGGVGSIHRAVMLFNLWAGDLGSEATRAAENHATQ